MTWLLEDPVPILTIGGIALVLLGVAFYHTQRVILLLGMAGVAVMVGLCVLAEWLVVTQAEEVENTLYAIAEALEANDLDAVLSVFDPEATTTRGMLKMYLPMIEVEYASVGSPAVTIARGTSPPKAEATFMGKVEYKLRDRSQAAFERPVIRRFVVELHKLNGRWLVTGYREAPLGGSGDDL